MVKELKSLIKTSSFFANDSEEKKLTNLDKMKDSRRVFMILKSFKELPNSKDYVYRTINNEIIDPEFNKLVQNALKSKSFVSLDSESFDKSALPLTIFIEGAMKLFLTGSLKNLIQMCHQSPPKVYTPLSKSIFISGYDIIMKCILEPTKTLFDTKLNFVYSSGIPMIFHSNY